MEFGDCFEEDRNTITYPALYEVLGVAYKYIKFIVYHFFVVFLGIPLLFIAAIVNGIAVFTLVWIWGPLMKLMVATLYAVAPVYTVPTQIALTPIMDSFGRVFRQIIIQTKLSGGMVMVKQQHNA